MTLSQLQKDRFIMKNTKVVPVLGRQLLRLNGLMCKVGLGRTSIYDRIKKGEFPPPVRIGARAVAWPSDEIDNWIEAQIEKSNNLGGGRGNE